MIMQDFITAKDRLNIFDNHLNDYSDNECTGCGKTPEEIMQEQGIDEIEIEECAVTTNSGLWYCHEDCFRDSR